MGGSVFTIIVIWSLVTRRSVPLNILYPVLAVTFIWAGFLAWRKEVQALSSLRMALPPSPGNTGRELIFVNETPSFLTQLSAGHTSIQAGKLLEPYLGKWIKVPSVTIRNIKETRPSEHLVFGNSKDGTSLALWFGAKWAERIVILRGGSEIAIIGKITSAEQDLCLESCEIISMSSLSDPTPVPPS